MDQEYKCQDCGTGINEGEARTFGVCDGCWVKAFSKKPDRCDDGSIRRAGEDAVVSRDDILELRGTLYGWVSSCSLTKVNGNDYFLMPKPMAKRIMHLLGVSLISQQEYDSETKSPKQL